MHVLATTLRSTTAFLAVAALVLAALAPAASAQDPAAERLYAEALRLRQAGDADASLAELELLVQQFPSDQLASKALLEVAEIRHGKGDTLATRAALERLRADYGRTLESAAAFVMQAEIEVEEARRTSELEEARATFRRVPLLYGRETYPDLEHRMIARVRTGELSLQLDEPHLAIAELLAAVEDEPPNRWTGKARLLLATALTRSGNWIAAAEVLQRLASETGAGVGGTVHSTAAERASAVRWLGLIHRRIVRPLSGQRHWLEAGRFPPSGLQLKEPSGVAAADDGRVLIVDSDLPIVAVADPDGHISARVALRDARRPGWSHGSPYVVTEERIVLPFDDRESPRFLEPTPGKEKPLKNLLAAERGPFGDWFILAGGWRSLLSFETSRQGQELLATSKPDLEDIAQDHLGRIYVLDRKTEAVLRVGVDRRSAETVLKGNWKRPVALALDPLGNYYVLDRGSKTVEMFDVNGQLQASVGPVLDGGIELRNPVDLAVDGSGRLFIADSRLPFIVVLD